MKNKIYVGLRAGATSIVFRSATEPTETSHGKMFNAVMGPFRTLRGARFAALFGRGNPHIQHVNDAERIAKIHAYP